MTMMMDGLRSIEVRLWRRVVLFFGVAWTLYMYTLIYVFLNMEIPLCCVCVVRRVWGSVVNKMSSIKTKTHSERF